MRQFFRWASRNTRRGWGQTTGFALRGHLSRDEVSGNSDSTVVAVGHADISRVGVDDHAPFADWN